MASTLTFTAALCLLAFVCYQCQGQGIQVKNNYQSPAAERSVRSDFDNVLGRGENTVASRKDSCGMKHYNLRIVRYFDFGSDVLTCTGRVATPTCIGYCDNAISWYLVHPHDFSVKRKGKCCAANKFGHNNKQVPMSCTGSDIVTQLTINWSGIVVDSCTN